MPETRINAFDVVLLAVGIGASYLGFMLINTVYSIEGNKLSWMMTITIFCWLILLVLFIMLSLIVDISRKELREIRALIFLLSEQQKKKK
jgi:hypothetical protein